MKVYTKTGDEGETSLFGGQRVSKGELRIEATGTVDELNSILGIVRSGCEFDEISHVVETIQNKLFELGADLATPLSSKTARVRRMDVQDVVDLERMIDSIDQDLPPLRSFILPGGTVSASRIHNARSVCRRAERLIVRLAKTEPLTTSILPFVNRLSDLLFVLARKANQLSNVPEIEWKG